MFEKNANNCWHLNIYLHKYMMQYISCFAELSMIFLQLRADLVLKEFSQALCIFDKFAVMELHKLVLK